MKQTISKKMRKFKQIISHKREYLLDIVLSLKIVWVIISITVLAGLTFIIASNEDEIINIASKLSFEHKNNEKCILCGITGAIIEIKKINIKLAMNYNSYLCLFASLVLFNSLCFFIFIIRKIKLLLNSS